MNIIPSTWAIVSAANRGGQLAGTTHTLFGRSVPIQFTSLDAPETRLQGTTARACHAVSDARVVVVVPDDCLALARDQLRALPGVRIVGQPRDVGPLPGLLLPLAHVLENEPEARVLVYPCDGDARLADSFVLDGPDFWRRTMEANPFLERPFASYRASIGRAKQIQVCRAVYAALPTI